MLTAVQNRGRLGYGAVYTTPAAFLYLLSGDISTSQLVIQTPILDWTYRVEEWQLIILLMLSLYCSMWVHRMGLLIFGGEGRMQAKRSSKTTRQHLLYFLTGVSPSKQADSNSLLELLPSAVAHDDFSWIILARAVPTAGYQLYNILAWFMLSAVLFGGQQGIIPAVLWLITTILIFRRRIVNYLPDYIPEENPDDITEPYYKTKAQQINEQQSVENSNPRINKSKTDN
jgi:hypothetical protein